MGKSLVSCFFETQCINYTCAHKLTVSQFNQAHGTKKQKSKKKVKKTDVLRRNDNGESP